MDTHKHSAPASRLSKAWPTVVTWKIFIATAIAVAATSVGAESAMFKHRSSDGTMTFSDAPMVNGQIVRSSYSNQYGRQMATNSCSGLTHSQLNARGMDYHSAFLNAAKETSLEPHWIMAVARVESCFDAKALSRAGAMGLMQLMPATARELGVVDAHNPIQNLQGGTRYLDSMNRRFADMNLALAAYNAGPGTVERFGGIPPYPETTRYIELVTRFASQYKPLFNGKANLSRP